MNPGYDWAAVKAIVSDIDGTLFTVEEGCTPRVIRGLSRATRCGARLILATGRSIHELGVLPPRLLQLGHVVANGGSLTWSRYPNEISARHPFSRDCADSVLSVVKERMPMAAVLVESSRLRLFERSYFDMSENRYGGTVMTTGSLPSAYADGVLKISVRDNRTSSEELLIELQQYLDSALTTVFSRRFPATVEILPAGVSKLSAVEAVLNDLAVSRAEVVAIGDMPNDLELLRWAGMGVAMANAHASVLEAADAVCPPVGSDGAATVLERICGSRTKTEVNGG